MDTSVASAVAPVIPLYEAVTLGLVQGLTEFLPISSTAHLRVVPALFHWTDPGVAYSAVIQLGSVLAVLCFFWRDLLTISLGTFKAIKDKNFADRDFRLAGSIIVGTIPICLLGLALKHVLEQNGGPLRSLFVIGGASLVMGVLLFVAERVAKRERTIDSISGKDGLLVGLGQAMALIPGCSRSGSTLTVALFLNLKREDAARYSFLLGIPAVVLSGLLELKEMVQTGVDSNALSSLGIGLAVSTVVSYAAIWWMLKFLQKHSTTVFIVYRLIFGVSVIALCAAGFIQ